MMNGDVPMICLISVRQGTQSNGEKDGLYTYLQMEPKLTAFYYICSDHQEKAALRMQRELLCGKKFVCVAADSVD